MLGLIGGIPFIWKLGAVLVLVVGILGYIGFLKLDNARLERDFAETQADLEAARRDAAIYEEANRRTVESFNRYVAETERTNQILAAAAEAANTRAASHAALQAEIDNVPSQTGCPVAPVLERALDGLRNLREAGSDAGGG